MIQEGINVINFLYSWKFWITLIIIFLIVAWIWSNVVSVFRPHRKKKHRKRKYRKYNQEIDYDSEDQYSEEEYSEDE